MVSVEVQPPAAGSAVDAASDSTRHARESLLVIEFDVIVELLFWILPDCAMNGVVVLTFRYATH